MQLIFPFLNISIMLYPFSQSQNNQSPCLYSSKACKSQVLRLRSEMYLVDAGLGTARMSLQDEFTGPTRSQKACRFSQLQGVFFNYKRERFPKKRSRFSTFKDQNSQNINLLSKQEFPIKKQILDRFFMDLVAGEFQIKERAISIWSRLNFQVGSVAGERLMILPRRFRQQRAWMELNNLWRFSSTQVKSSLSVKGLFFEKVKRGYLVAIAGFITFLPFRLLTRRRMNFKSPRFTIKSIQPKKKKICVSAIY